MRLRDVWAGALVVGMLSAALAHPAAAAVSQSQDDKQQWRFEPSTIPETGVVITVKAVFAPK